MKSLLLLLLVVLMPFGLSASCKEPFSLKYTNITSGSITINWFDNNSGPLGYQLAYGEKGILLVNAPKTGIVPEKNITLNGLMSGTTHVFWIRTVCAPEDTSKWAGPFTFTTAITNPSVCGLSLDLRDNNCDNGLTDVFNIQVVLPVTANPYKLQSVSLIAEHPWPADLFIQLESPQGARIVLSDRHGTVDDNYGIPDSTCAMPAIFSDEACLSVSEGVPPFAGTFKPDEALSLITLPANPSGLWKLLVCDGAINDKGVLKYVSLNFVPEPCNTVDNFFVSKITNTSFEVSWGVPDNCKNLEIHYQKKSQPSTAKMVVVNCSLGKYEVKGLDMDEEYDFFLVSSCLSSGFSVPSCTRTFNTSCATVNIVESFENQSMCLQNCGENCEINGVFANDQNDDTDWIVSSGSTPTEFTGPSSGVNGGGNYVYLESNPSLCKPAMTGILQTTCLKSGSQASFCDIDFSYHMYGKDIGRLQLEISDNDGQTWSSLFSVSGDQGNQWKKQTMPLSIAAETLFSIRFSGKTSSGSEGDIALDLIALGNISTAEEAYYYRDLDGDGYGIQDMFIRRCDSKVPVGYSRIAGDCDDTNPQIHPNAVDIPCNQVDENCDGTLVLADTVNPVVIIKADITNETCNGKKDGVISITTAGGSPPLQYEWLHGASGSLIAGLGSGFYKCKITDANGCGLESQFLEIKSVSNFQAIVESITRPGCTGVSDGTIKISHNGIFTPFTFQWSRGDTTQNLYNVAEGAYQLTITNGIGCKKELGPIQVNAASSLQPVITFLKKPLCASDATGIIEVNVLNGIPPYQLIWQDGFTGNRRTQLKAGTYTVTITDASQCKLIYNAVLPGPEPLQLSLLNLEDVRCFGTKTGEIRVLASGGTQPYTYAWNDNGPAIHYRPNLIAGNYNITVYDDNGCRASRDNIMVRQPSELKYTIDEVLPAGCLLKPDGSIKTTVSGGLPPYKYFWKGTDQTTDDITSLLPGTYILTAVDANNCKLTTESVVLSGGNTSWPVEVKKLKDNKCPGDSEGLIKAVISQGVAPFDFNWSNGTQRMVAFNEDSISGLMGGSYRVTITDANGCVSTSPEIIVQTLSSFNYGLVVEGNLCNTDSNGSIAINISGATPPYDVLWSNGQNGRIAEGLLNGKYMATVSDARNCTFEVNDILISSVSDIQVDVLISGTVPGQKNGSINLKPSGGQGNYRVTWDTMSIQGLNPEMLGEGSYVFTVFDELGCMYSDTAYVNLTSSNIEENNFSIDVYPVPSSDILWVSGRDVYRHDLYVYNLKGELKVVIPQCESGEACRIDIQLLPSGLYILCMRQKGLGPLQRVVRFMKI